MESAAARAGNAGARDQSERRGVVRRLSTETKAAFKTTEFWAMVVVIVGILVAAATIKGGDTAPGTDEFIAKQAWLYVAIVAVGYMISRGLAKSGSRSPTRSTGTATTSSNGTTRTVCRGAASQPPLFHSSKVVVRRTNSSAGTG